MSEFVKKTLMGYKEVLGGYSDPECTHVILTVKEYSKQLRAVSNAELKANNIKADVDQVIQKVRSDAQRRVMAAESAAKQEVTALEQKLAVERKENKFQRGLNTNLLRIARERANADRKLRPKKAHTGYVVVSSMEKEYRYKDGNRHWNTVMLWETVLETPYIVDFEVTAVKNLIQELFQKGEDGCWLIQKIGITGNFEAGYADMITDRAWIEKYQRYNVMLERRLKANYRTGYWEIIFLHTKSLVSVPVDMRAV